MIPLQQPGFGATLGLLFFVGSAISIVVGAFVAYRAFRAHRRTEQRSLLLFSTGLVLLVSVSKVVNVVLSSTLPSTALVGPATELCRLLGAIVITYAIYDR
jgi:cell division protein FtsW (lipid II flippase)